MLQRKADFFSFAKTISGLAIFFSERSGSVSSVISAKIQENNEKQMNLLCFSLDFFVTLASPKLLAFGKTQIKFGFSLDFFVTLASPKLLMFGKTQIKFGFSLT